MGNDQGKVNADHISKKFSIFQQKDDPRYGYICIVADNKQRLFIVKQKKDEPGMQKRIQTVQDLINVNLLPLNYSTHEDLMDAHTGVYGQKMFFPYL